MAEGAGTFQLLHHRPPAHSEGPAPVLACPAQQGVPTQGNRAIPQRHEPVSVMSKDHDSLAYVHSLRPAMETFTAGHVWTLEEVVGLLD